MWNLFYICCPNKLESICSLLFSKKSLCTPHNFCWNRWKLQFLFLCLWSKNAQKSTGFRPPPENGVHYYSSWITAFRQILCNGNILSFLQTGYHLRWILSYVYSFVNRGEDNEQTSENSVLNTIQSLSETFNSNHKETKDKRNLDTRMTKWHQNNEIK